MTITSTALIAQLKFCGMQTLILKIRLDAEDAVESEPLSEPNIATEPELTAVENPPPEPQVVPFVEELSDADRSITLQKRASGTLCATPNRDGQ